MARVPGMWHGSERLGLERERQEEARPGNGFRKTMLGVGRALTPRQMDSRGKD